MYLQFSWGRLKAPLHLLALLREPEFTCRDIFWFMDYWTTRCTVACSNSELIWADMFEPDTDSHEAEEELLVQQADASERWVSSVSAPIWRVIKIGYLGSFHVKNQDFHHGGQVFMWTRGGRKLQNLK